MVHTLAHDSPQQQPLGPIYTFMEAILTHPSHCALIAYLAGVVLTSFFISPVARSSLQQEKLLGHRKACPHTYIYSLLVVSAHLLSGILPLTCQARVFFLGFLGSIPTSWYRLHHHHLLNLTLFITALKAILFSPLKLACFSCTFI